MPYLDQMKTVPAGGHVLPPLPYETNALEPIIDEKTLMIHHDMHHRKYVDDLNQTELALLKARQTGQLDNIQILSDKLAFNGSGHILHSIYWTIMAKPGAGGNPGTATSEMAESYFGGMQAFKSQFQRAAAEVEGSGWSVLCLNPAFGHLEILQSEKHQNGTQWGVIPILVCDVWEHAYYLKYQNRRQEYIEKWWSLVNWYEVEHRLLMAKNGKLSLTVF